jgi:hypothetical protein
VASRDAALALLPVHAWRRHVLAARLVLVAVEGGGGKRRRLRGYWEAQPPFVPPLVGQLGASPAVS